MRRKGQPYVISKGRSQSSNSTMATYRQKQADRGARHTVKPKQTVGQPSLAPMGEDRFRQLMAALSASFAEADGGKEQRARMKERERQHEVWMAERAEVIKSIVETMELYHLSADDLI